MKEPRPLLVMMIEKDLPGTKFGGEKKGLRYLICLQYRDMKGMDVK